jgi:excinuclease ABC subunit B
MFRGDRARKQTLVDFGFRLPSALDNRPLKFDEFEARVHQAIHMSATPGSYEMQQAGEAIVDQLIRPTGLIDPEVIIRPVKDQVDDVLHEVRLTVARGFRVLVTTLTKRMAEDLTEYFQEAGVRVRYLHSDVDTLDRIALIDDLRAGAYDVLVGINLLREGLDIPEVALVTILDADKEGFLRSERSLVQTIGRAARNAEGRVIMYADRITGSMAAAIAETERRRTLQMAHNQAHGITPRTIVRASGAGPKPEEYQPSEDTPKRGKGGAGRTKKSGRADAPPALARALGGTTAGAPRIKDAPVTKKDLETRIAACRKDMIAAAQKLDFEKAADLRDELKGLEALLLAVG